MLYNPNPPTQQDLHQHRGGNAANCEHCNKPLRPKRGSRRQQFCSDRCRKAAERADQWHAQFDAPGRTEPRQTGSGSQHGGVSGSVQNTPLVSKACKGDFADRPSAISGPRVVIETEIMAGRDWQPVTSPDDVCCEVTQIGLSAATKAKAAEYIAEIPADLSIPQFLRRQP